MSNFDGVLTLQDCLSPLSMQALPAPAESLCIVEMGAGDSKTQEEGSTSQTNLYLNVGLQNGVLLRTVLDPVTGDLADTRTRYLGSRPVKLFRIRMQGSEAVSLFRSLITMFIWGFDVLNFFHLGASNVE